MDEEFVQQPPRRPARANSGGASSARMDTQYSGNTDRAYTKAWIAYTNWCSFKGCDPLNGDPHMIAGYLASVADRLAYNSLRAHVTAIASKHRVNGISVDTKHGAIASILAQAKHKSPEPARLALPLVSKQIRALIQCLPNGTVGARDRTIILVGYWLGVSLQDLVAINCEDLAAQGDSVVLNIRRENRSDPQDHRYTLRPSFTADACPVRAVNAWLAVRGTHSGPLFPRLLKGGKLTNDRVSSAHVNLLIKRLAKAAGLDTQPLTGRSLRTGFAATTSFSPAARRLQRTADRSSELEPQVQLPSTDLEAAAGTISQGIGPISFDVNARWEIRLGLMIDELSRLQSAVVGEQMKHLGITRIQYFALSEISGSAGLAQSALARRLNLTNVGVSGLVSRMVTGGWVVRQSDKSDNRIKRLYLTDKAFELIRELRYIVEEVTTATFRNIAEDDGHDILRVLAGMRLVLVAISESGSLHPWRDASANG